MKKQFILAVCLLIICVSVLFGGCAQTVQMTTIYADGSRSYNYTIILTPTLCAQVGIDSTRAMELIDTGTREYWATFSAGRNVEGVTFKAQTDPQNANKYTISLLFNSFEDYLTFYGRTLEEVLNQPAEYEKSLFVSRSVLVDSKLDTSSDLILEMQIIPALTQNLITSFANEFFGGDTAQVVALFEQIETNIARVYPSVYKTHSNATSTQKIIGASGVTSIEESNYTAHIWTCTLADPTPHIYVYRNVFLQENRIAWYVLAIGVALISGLVIYLVLYFKNKNNEADKVFFMMTNSANSEQNTTATNPQKTTDTAQNIQNTTDIDNNENTGDNPVNDIDKDNKSQNDD